MALWYTNFYMTAERPTKKRKASLEIILSTVERGFAAVAEDIADIKSRLATKDNVRVVMREELKPVRSDLKSIRDELDELTEKLENVSGFRKEIDHALARIAAIERHLGITKKIAA